MGALNRLGNDLYTGTRSVPFVARRKVWFTISAVLIIVAVVGTIARGGFSFGIEFTGGSEFVVSHTTVTDQALASSTVTKVAPDAETKVTRVGDSSIRVQTSQLSNTETVAVKDGLATAYNVPQDDVSSSFIGATWGADITSQALRGLGVFLALAALLMAIYFRTWKMSLVAIIALVHDLVITAGIYGLTGLDVTPGTIIGLLTILGYSLYDTVVVFDKIRENTTGPTRALNLAFADQVNLAVNQTLVRSINTAVVAALPVAAILGIGALLLGAGTLKDISLALLVGIAVGTYSTMFLAAPLYSLLREREPAIAKSSRKITPTVVTS